MITIITALATFLIGGIIGTTMVRRKDTPDALPRDDFDYALYRARELIDQGLPGKALTYLDRIEERMNTNHARKTQSITFHKNQASRLIQRADT